MSSRIAAGLALAMVVVVGCNADDHDATSPNPDAQTGTTDTARTTVASSNSDFCDAATAILERSFPPDGGEVIRDLRSRDLTSLDAQQKAWLLAAVENLEQNLARFNNGAAPDGWITEEVAAQATAICGTTVAAHYVVP